MTECPGMTWADLQAIMIAAGYHEAVNDERMHAALDRMIAAGAIKRCSRHPDRYITRKQRKAPRPV